MISKTELTQFIRLFYPSVNDVQQARHLGAQKGWYILSGGRDNIVLEVKPGYYQLYSLEQPYPQFHGHRISDTSDWEDIKAQHSYHCATCGSIENKPNIHWPATKTKLQKAHMDPYESLIPGNIIPQCQKCNRGDRNRWVYDERGRVVQLATAAVIKSSRPNVRWEVYKILYKEFNGENPNGKKQLINQVLLGDSLELLKKNSDNSIDLVLTDPPYFLDKLDNNWNYQQVINKKNQYTVKSLPAGMKFSREQGIKFYKWFYNLSEQIFRVLKPGGFFFSFSSPRLYHRMTSAIDDAGFEIRDCFLWIYTQNQAKAMGMDHLIKKMKITEEEKEVISKKLDGWKTPQIKSCFEPIAMAQKPVEKTYLNNILAHNVGLFNTKIKVGDNMFPSNILLVDEVDGELDRYFLISKPNKQEKERV